MFPLSTCLRIPDPSSHRRAAVPHPFFASATCHPALPPYVSRVRLLDRYLIRNFLLPFVYCVLGFLAVWLVFELGSHATEFVSGGVPLKGIAAFYWSQLPSIALIVLPIGLLLALLYCLGKMSQSNELLAMLSSGVSLERILVPIFIIGLLVTGLSTFLSYAPAPRADAQREVAEAEIEAGHKFERLQYTLGYLFRNHRDKRLWYVEKLWSDLSKPLENVQIIQQDANDDITDKLYAKQAVYEEARHTWVFTDTRLVHYTATGDVDKLQYLPTHEVSGWSETPWRVYSAQLQPDKLTVPELDQYLDINGDLNRAQLAPFRTYHDVRWSLPWQCFVVVLFAAPLGIVYQRRSVIAGVATAIFLFLGILFFDNLFRALGGGDRGISPLWAAWATNVFFGLIGVVLLRQKALNRDKLPLTPGRLWDYLTA